MDDFSAVTHVRPQIPSAESDENDALEDKFALRPARGAAIAVVIGTFIWIVLVVLGLNLFSPSVLPIASLCRILIGAAVCAVAALLALLGMLRPLFAFCFRCWLRLRGKRPHVADNPEENTDPTGPPAEGNWAASPADVVGIGNR
jgi:hypothetical protein